LTKVLDNTLSILAQVAQYFAEEQADIYLVGGSLRNLVLGEPCVDWDLMTNGKAHTLARHLAERLGGVSARLHEKASRVTVHNVAQGTDLVLDISPMHGNTLEEDLRARDFTLNALAAPLSAVLEQLVHSNTLAYANMVLIDPLHGLDDLLAHQIKAIDTHVFRHDPLRMLRALRLARRYGLTIDTPTVALIKRDAALLQQVAAERVHEELYALLGYADALEQLHLLDEYGLLTVLFPELCAGRSMRQPFPHHWDVLEHSLQCVGALEVLANALQADPESVFPPELACTPAANEDLTVMRTLLYEAEQQSIFSFAELHTPRMKLATLLHDIGKPLTFTVSENGAIHFYNHPHVGAPIASAIMRRLSASTPDRRLAQLIAAHHMRPGQLGQDGSAVTPRAIRRYFVDLGPTGILVTLFSLADHLATLGPQPRTLAWTRHLSVARLLLTSYIRERATILPPRLLKSDELMSRLKIQPGPLVGQLLEMLAEAQTEGTIHSREEALLLAREYMQMQQKQEDS
jgi:poly(A) polymerase